MDSLGSKYRLYCLQFSLYSIWSDYLSRFQMVMYGEQICKKSAQIKQQKRIRVSNHAFSNIFRAGGKNCDGANDE